VPIGGYGVLAGRARQAKVAGRSGKPHYQIEVAIDGSSHRVAVNVRSDQSPTDLLFLLKPDYRHAVLASLPDLDDGFTPIPSRPGGLALDFVRGDLFRPEDMSALPFAAPGPANDLEDVFDLHVHQAIDAGARFYAFGSKWGPEPDKADEYFLFTPGSGVHDIHLNQGSPGPHAGDNGVWQDGALFIQYPASNRWLAFFLAFQTQFAHTDDNGDPTPGSPRFGPGPASPG
jgi:uncharacterized protein YukJ